LQDRFGRTLLCEVENWYKASELLEMPISGEYLHKQLEIWSYYQEAIYIYNLMLGKIFSDKDSIWFLGLGNIIL
jgi:hypothetical protein